MTIVKRLRQKLTWGFWPRTTIDTSLLNEAADTIEKLQRDVDRWQQQAVDREYECNAWASRSWEVEKQMQSLQKTLKQCEDILLVYATGSIAHETGLLARKTLKELKND